MRKGRKNHKRVPNLQPALPGWFSWKSLSFARWSARPIYSCF